MLRCAGEHAVDDASDDDALQQLGFLDLEECEAGRVVEDAVDALARLCGALEVLLRAQFSRHDFALF